jgi:phosphate uptake regulator
MKRKVIQLAGKTFVISLPSKWAKMHGVKKGDELEIEEQGSKLTVKTDTLKAPAKKELDCDRLEMLTRRSLLRQYHEGTDEIQVNFSNPQKIKDIKEYLNELIGYEIVKQGNNYAIISDVTGQKQQDFNQIMRRLFLLLKGIMEDTLTAFRQNDREALKTLVFRDEEINKFTHFCLRLLAKQNTQEERKSSYFTMLYLLERISDDYRNMIKYIAETKGKLDEETIKISEKIHEFYTRIYEFTFDTNITTAKEIALSYAQLRERTKKYMETKNTRTGFYLHAITNTLIAIQELQLPYIT